MPKDYKNSRRQPARVQSHSRWRYFLAGLALGLSGSMGLFFLGDDVGDLMASHSHAAPVVQAELDSPPVSEPPKAKFDFYQLLPEMEVATVR